MPKSKRLQQEIVEIKKMLQYDVTSGNDLSTYVDRIESINQRYCPENNYLKPAYECFYNETEDGRKTMISDLDEYYKNKPDELKKKVDFSKCHLRKSICKLQEWMDIMPQM